ncbi:unnamed protein product [Owenia fusiformis]|uniref:Uncharacterized protein n=1 Tax=Owenia fusiformis TaxID=6347 RepID=A0A8J1UQE0_OWEFU|nr:unnamed protein product [Owenia fusiformis]
MMMMYGVILAATCLVTHVSTRRTCFSEVDCDATNKEYCCGCDKMFLDGYDNEPKTPYFMLTQGACKSRSCLTKPDENAPIGTCARELWEGFEKKRTGEPVCGVDLVFDINISRSTSRAGVNVWFEEVADGLVREFMKRLVKQLRIGRTSKQSLVGAMGYYGDTRRHFGVRQNPNIGDLLTAIDGIDLSYVRKSKPYKSFNAIRENFFGDTKDGARKMNKNVVIVFDDGVFSRGDRRGRAWDKFNKAVKALHEVAEVFVIGIRNGYQVTTEDALPNLTLMASEPKETHLITTSIEKFSNGRLDELVFETIRVLPTDCLINHPPE